MGVRFFRMIVALMPREFRREYGAEVCRVAKEQYDDLRTSGAGAFTENRINTNFG